MSIEKRIREARELLVALGMDPERSNERSALVFLALLALDPDDPWADAGNPMLGTRAVMDFIRDEYARNYAPNTRETVRRFTLHQFAEALLVVQNPDQPERPVNSPKWNYQVTSEALHVVQAYGRVDFQATLDTYLEAVPGLKAQYAAVREMERIPLMLPDGTKFALSAGGQNVLLKQMVEDLCPRFMPGAEVLYIGDAGDKWALFERDRLASLGLPCARTARCPTLWSM